MDTCILPLKWKKELDICGRLKWQGFYHGTKLVKLYFSLYPKWGWGEGEEKLNFLAPNGIKLVVFN